MIFHAKENINSLFLVFLCRAEAISSSFLRLSKFRKYYGKIASVPTYCLEKDFFLLPEIHNINFSFILKFTNSSFLLNMNFPFVQSSCFYNSFFHTNLFLIAILKRPKAILITRQNVKLN